MNGGEQVAYVRLTGQPVATTGLEDVTFLPDKRFKLLSYLAYNGGWVGRERAAFLFWPDSDTSTSRQNLRGLIQRLRTLPFEPGLDATKHQLRWQVPTDVAAFNEAATTGDASRAIATYRGPLMEGLDGSEDGEFGEWLEIEREQIYSRWRSLALARLAAPGSVTDGEAADLIRRLLEADPLDEEAVRTHMQALTSSGRLFEAIRAFQELASRLGREMGLEPTSETVAAYELARSNASTERKLEPGEVPRVTTAEERATQARVISAETSHGVAVRSFRRPVAPNTSFVGREEELADVVARLRDPDCRLLSLTGPGGVGKTRLALAAAEELSPHFADGVVFVPLDRVSSPEEVLPAIAAAVGLDQTSNPDPWGRLSDLLSESNVLLLIDNFEHVLGAAGTLARLATSCPDVKVLVTTRERLGLEAEWLYLVGGLDFPKGVVELERLAGYGAIRLLVDRAQRMRPGFRLVSEDLALIDRLFALTQGLPLAIELVAAWLRAVPLATLLDEIERDPGALTAATSDTVARHDSIGAVFEQSWARLSGVERTVLRQLSVFAGSITPEAAAFVAGASRTVIASLVDKSLLRLDEDGRYDRHPLVLAFTREKMAEYPREQQAVEFRHAAYYLRFLRERTDRAKGPRPALVQQEIHAEVRELRTAMKRAHDRGRNAVLVAYMHLLELELGYFQAHGHDDETLSLLGRAADVAAATGALDVARDLRGRVGDSYAIHRGDAGSALTHYVMAVELAKQTGNIGREAVLTGLCGVMRRLMNPSSGQDDLDRGLALARASKDPLTLSTVLEHRAFALTTEGDLDGAREFYLLSLRAVDEPQDHGDVHPFDLARRRYFAAVNLGDIDRRLGRVDDALAARFDALRIAKEVGNQIWEANVLLELGVLRAELRHDDAAREHIRHARSIYRTYNVTAQLEKVDEIAEKHGYDVRD